jgi:hypothetical protein
MIAARGLKAGFFEPANSVFGGRRNRHMEALGEQLVETPKSHRDD